MIVVYVILAIVVILFAAVLIRTLNMRPAAVSAQPLPVDVDGDVAAQHLGEAIRHKTVSMSTPEECDWEEWRKFHAFLERTYPLMNSRLERETLHEYALLYRWKGRDESKLPILLMAHIDVVPVAEGTLSEWKYPPFSGEIAEGYVWGRGAVDMKGSLIAIAEAVETLLAQGFAPERDVYISFGHDEEVMGESGAMATAAILKERGIRFEFVLDEGSPMRSGAPFGVARSIAGIGTSEKGYIDVKLTARSKGGHSSTPPEKTALTELAEAVAKVAASPMSYRIEGSTKDLLLSLAPYMSFGSRMQYANLWLFSGMIKRRLKKDPYMAALLHTTFAPTQAKGSAAPNVLADEASAIINVRIAPWDSIEGVLAYIAEKAGPRVEVSCQLTSPPTGVAPMSGAPYRYMADTVKRMFPDYIVAPFPMLAATDSRYFTGLSENILRFVPFRSFEKDAAGMHGVNERVSLESLAEGTAFFKHMIEHCEEGLAQNK